jgi:nucleotide-binding universal stress UspA family protein
MKPFPKILFPCDYSEAATLAAPFVRDMALANETELTVLHALPLMPLPASAGDFMGAIPMAPASAEIRTAERERLAFFCAKHFSGLNVAELLVDGEPAPAIEETVSKRDISLVMMPTHGSGVLRRLLLGSVTAKILHDLDCKVWTFVPGHVLPHQAGPMPRSVVCAIPGDATADPLIARAAAEIARTWNARLTLVHVVEPPPVTWEFDFEPYRDKLLGDAEARLFKLDAELGLDAGVRVICDFVPRGLHDVAAEEKADLLVVGRGHARQALGRIWSQLYETLREAPCPVLSV